MLPRLLTIAALIVLSGFFSGTETAFTSLSAAQIHHIRDKWGKRGRMVAASSENPERLLTVVLIGNNVVNIAASVLAGEFTVRVFGSGALGITTAILTLLVLVFGEVTPKQLAISYNESWSVHTVRLITFLDLILRPVVWAIASVVLLITRLSGAKQSESVTREGLLSLVKHAEHVGVLENSKSRMVKNVFRFGDVTVESIMTHRTRVFSLDRSLTIDNALHEISLHGFSRVPVYDADPERIVGIVILRDLLQRREQGDGGASIAEVMVDPIFVSEHRSVEEMLTQFRAEGLNMAVVLDEYGGVSGIVTLEDAIEEILGELYDEHESKHREPVTDMGDGSVRIMADAPVYVVNELLDVGIPDVRGGKTVGGYLMTRIGHIPVVGEEVDTDIGRFVVETMTGRRIVAVRLRLTSPSDDEDGDWGQ